MRNRTKAFTLVELLVVIGILALLISMLLPALNKARQQANSVQCLSNLRQVGQIVHLYAAENQGRLPYNYIAWPDGERKGAGWALMVGAGYLKSSELHTERIKRAGGGTASNIFTNDVLTCPTAINEIKWGAQAVGAGTVKGRFRNSGELDFFREMGADEAQWVYTDWDSGNASRKHQTPRVYSHYVFNSYVDSNAYGAATGNPGYKINGKPVTVSFGNAGVKNGTPFDSGQRRISSVQKPSETWMAWEAGSGNQHTIARAAFRHPHVSLNFAYFDGHGENVRAIDMAGGTNNWTPAPGALTRAVIYDERVLIRKD